MKLDSRTSKTVRNTFIEETYIIIIYRSASFTIANYKTFFEYKLVIHQWKYL